LYYDQYFHYRENRRGALRPLEPTGEVSRHFAWHNSLFSCVIGGFGMRLVTRIGLLGILACAALFAQATVTLTLNSGSQTSPYYPPGTINEAGLTFQATVTLAGNAIGAETVTLTDSLLGSPIDSVTVVGAGFPETIAYTFTIPAGTLPAGSNVLTVSYLGDIGTGGGNAAVSAQFTETIQSATETFVSAPASSVFGAPVTLTASVFTTSNFTQVTAGSVTFYDGATVLGTAPVSNGNSFSISTPMLSQGKRTIWARYDGAGNGAFAPSLSSFPASLTVTSSAQSGFAAEATSGAISRANGVVVGDFNGDGIEDLAVVTLPAVPGGCSPNCGGVQILLGTGIATSPFLAPSVLYGTSGAPVGAIAAADFNGDGHTDLVLATNTGVEVLINNGAGAFPNPSVRTTLGAAGFSSLSSIAVADFNGDGFPDVIVGGLNTNANSAASVLLGNGSGGFPTVNSVTATLNGIVYVATADFNNDGKADLALADSNDDVDVLIGHGDGTFQAQAATPVNLDSSPLLSIAVGDLNGDGRPDIVVGAVGGSVSVFFNNGAGTFPNLGNAGTTTLTVVSGFESPVAPLVAIGDFNGDGTPDVAVADATNGGIYVFLNTNVAPNNPSANEAFGAQTLYATSSSATAIAVGSFATHGFGDIAITDGSEAGIFLGLVPVAIVPPPPSTTYSPLTISTTSLPAGLVGQSYSASLAASGGSGNYLWSATGLPQPLTLSSAGIISGTPTAVFNGQVTFFVSDPTASYSNSATLTLVITFAPVVISGSGGGVITGPSSLGDVAVGSAVAASFSASGGVPPYTWALSGGDGLTVDANGNVRGAAAQAGNFSPTLTVTDKNQTTASVTLSLAVLGITGSLPAGTTTSTYSGSVSGVGGVPPYAYSASGVPQGLSFAGGTLSGQPSVAGAYTVGVQVTDSKGVGTSGNFSFTITGPLPKTFSITTTSLADGIVGQPYSETLTAAAGVPGYTWSQSGGQIPPGLTLAASGTVSGTPTVPGSYSIGVQVSDTSGAQIVGTVTVVILPAPLQITSGATFPNGLVGVQYPSQILTASGGIAPYTFSIKGFLPGGLTLTNAQVSGTPSAASSYSFTLVVTDSAAVPNTASLGATLLVSPNTPSLVLSSATTSFTLTAGSSAVPTPSTIQITSSTVTQVLPFTTSSSVPWLTLGGSSTTPGSITVGPNSAALALSSADSPYFGTVTVTCTSQYCAAGNKQTIAVTLTVPPSPPQLSLGSALLSFVALTSNLQSSSQGLSIVNSGGGSLALSSISAADTWISVGTFPATVAPGPGASVTITANPAGLNPGYYLSSVTVNSSAGSATVPVTLLISGASTMTLGPAGTQFSMPQGGALGNGSGSFLVSVSSGSFSYAAAVQPGATWLSGGGSGTATPSSPGTVSFSIDPTAAAALTAGAYYGTIRVTGSGIVNSPQDFQLVLNIGPANTTLAPNPQPAGLVFLSSGSALPSQTVQVFASSTNIIGFQASASVTTGSGWLSVSPAVGATSASFPASVSVTANAAGLSPGVYRGTVSFAFASSAPTVNVTLIVEAPLSAAAEGTPTLSSALSGGSPSPATSSPDASGPTCSGGQLVPTQTGLISNFSAPASWPTPLAITLVDTCGNAQGNGQVVATFSNGDPPLILAPTNTATGLYSGTWTPRNTSSQVAILARASVPGYTTATTQIAGRVPPNTAPSLNANGTSDIFHPQVGAGLGPGNIVQIYGSGLTGQIGSPAVLPLPTQVNNTSVLIGGVEAPLFYVSPTQIDAQIPFELTAGNQYQVIVNANGALTTPQPIQLTQAVPAILQFTSGAVVAQHQDGTLVSSTAPAAPGEYISFYMSGLGDTNPPVASGTASPSNPPATVVDTPVLTLNDTTIPVSFAGLAPGFVGLYQINFQVPSPLADGNYDIVITQDGAVSNQTVLQVANPVQQ
jgi:uncharacterized protein (TIGR03437 family)